MNGPKHVSVSHSPCYRLAIADKQTATQFHIEADILHPPLAILPSLPSDDSDADSRIHDDSRSLRSKTSSYYRRQIGLKSSYSLTDLRSIHQKFTEPTLSDGSIILPGPGYVYGNFVNFVGKNIISWIIDVDIRRRRWLIKRMIHKLQRADIHGRSRMFAKKLGEVRRASQDILELAKYLFISRHHAHH